MNLRQTILSHTTTVEPVEAFGTTCYIREMTGAEVAGYERFLQTNETHTSADIAAELLTRTLCDAGGERLFTDEQVAEVAKLPIHDIRTAYQVAVAMNRIDDDEVDAAEGNSDATPGSTPDSASR